MDKNLTRKGCSGNLGKHQHKDEDHEGRFSDLIASRTRSSITEIVTLLPSDFKHLGSA